MSQKLSNELHAEEKNNDPERKYICYSLGLKTSNKWFMKWTMSLCKGQ